MLDPVQLLWDRAAIDTTVMNREGRHLRRAVITIITDKVTCDESIEAAVR